MFSMRRFLSVQDIILLLLIGMPFEGIDVGKAPLHSGIDVVFCSRRTLGIPSHGQDSASSNTGLSVPGKLSRFRDHPGQLFPETTLSRQILGPNFGTSNVNAIAKWIHVGPALIDRMN